MNDEAKMFFKEMLEQLQNIEEEVRDLREEGITVTNIGVDTGVVSEVKVSDAIEKKVSSSIDNINTKLTSLPERLRAVETAIKDKDMVVNVPKFEIPELQKVEVKNQISLSNLSNLLESINTSIKGINISVPQQKIPEIIIPKYPTKITTAEGKQIVSSIKNLEKAIKGIKMPEVEIPGSVKVSNFPPQKYPMPVTNININPLRGFIKSRTVTVSTTITPLPGEVLSNRRSLIIYNNSSVTVELGGSTMTFGTGFPVAASATSPPIDAGPNMVLYGIVTTGTANVRVMEVSNENLAGG